MAVAEKKKNSFPTAKQNNAQPGCLRPGPHSPALPRPAKKNCAARGSRAPQVNKFPAKGGSGGPPQHLRASRGSGALLYSIISDKRWPSPLPRKPCNS